jgi:hypothetical protein
MVNYTEGKIYKIVSTVGDKVYYGSTTKKRLCDRMATHRGGYKHWLKGKSNLTTSIKLFEEYGIENCSIVLVEAYPCNTKDELTAREAHYIRNFECVNKNIPDRTIKEWRKDNKYKIKEYYEDNKYKLLEYNKQYREANKDKIAEQKKQYREANKDKLEEQRKQYYEDNKNKIKQYREANKDKIAEREKVKYTCICGSFICKAKKLRHDTSKKHIEFMKTR